MDEDEIDSITNRLTVALEVQSNSAASDEPSEGRIWLEGYFDLRAAIKIALG